MAITKAQQVRQMLEEGGKTKKIKGQEHILAYITPGEAKTLENLGGQKTMTPEGIPAYPPPGRGGQGPGGSGQDSGGQGPQGGDPERDNIPDRNRGQQQYTGLTPKQKQQIRDAREFQERQNKKIAEQKAQRKAIKEKEERQRKIREKELKRQRELKEKRSKIGLAATTKFGAPVGPMSPNRRSIIGLEKIGLAKSAIEDDDDDDKATAKAIVEQNPLEKFLGNFKPPSVALIEGILDNIPGRSLTDMYNQYGKKLGLTEKQYKDAVFAGEISTKGGPMGGRFRDSQGNLLGGREGPDNQIIPQVVPTTTGSVTSEEEVDNRTELEKLLDARGPAYRFFADGGRVPAQQGGIMFRLNELGSGVSSAEEMLQQINQRLDSAESTLGEGVGGGMFDMGQPGFNTNFNQQPLSPIQNSVSNFDPRFSTPIRSRPSYEDALSSYNQRIQSGMMTNDIERNKMRSRENYDSYNNNFEDPTIRNQRMQDQLQNPLGDPIGPRRPISRMELQERFESMYPPGHPRRIFGYMRDGGRAGYNMGGMADDDDPVGGIMDLESGRQMYFLGKLVKKATKTIKKIVKSPVGKAALLGGALYFGGGSGGLKNFFFKGGKMGLGNLTQRGLLTGILGTSALAGLMTPKQEEEEQEPYLGPSIDIPGIRKNPYAAMGETYRNYAEGGKAEPVAKKTMPLLDMDGMEKDYRETGGFVEMGRMERADDVPARLSKNEFVFTADAVRNAGDGDIDKGAEVMYNMMKNLESGGEVSEESQGLEGARKMFQTSQRLGEVI